MANDMNRRGFLKYAAASALGMGALGVMTGCSSKETASSSAASTSGAVYTPGTYTASAEGYGSDVTVTVTFDETSITNVVVDSSGETENVGAAAAEKPPRPARLSSRLWPTASVRPAAVPSWRAATWP